MMIAFLLTGLDCRCFFHDLGPEHHEHADDEDIFQVWLRGVRCCIHRVQYRAAGNGACLERG